MIASSAPSKYTGEFQCAPAPASCLHFTCQLLSRDHSWSPAGQREIFQVLAGRGGLATQQVQPLWDKVRARWWHFWFHVSPRRICDLLYILHCVTKYSQLAVGPQRVRTCTYPSHCERCRSVHTPPQAGLVTIEARSCATLCGMWGFRSVPEGICRMCRRGVVPYVSYSAVLSGIILAPACAIPHIK